MPYIKEEDRERLKVDSPRNAGELNYLFTMIAHAYIIKHGENYQNYNDLLGALEGCKLELYRRKISNYEDEKIKINGDVS